LAAGLRTLANNDALRALLAAGAVERFNDRFTARRMAAGFADALDGIWASQASQRGGDETRSF
jgi:hypothetical protein